MTKLELLQKMIDQTVTVRMSTFKPICEEWRGKLQRDNPKKRLFFVTAFKTVKRPYDGKTVRPQCQFYPSCITLINEKENLITLKY